MYKIVKNENGKNELEIVENIGIYQYYSIGKVN